jgi:predicted metalloprotease with PDZ domain
LSAHPSRLRRLLLIAVLLLQAGAFAQYSCPGWKNNGEVASQSWLYTVKLADPARHLLHITMTLQPTSPTLEVQLPVWNALYQIRDFAKNLNWIHAADADGKPVPVRQIDKTTWAVPNAASVEYEIVAADPGPFGADYNDRHAFLNLAQVLVYPVGHTHGQVLVAFADRPPDWQIATPLQVAAGNTEGYCADSYDHLVDSPVEIGTFRTLSFEEGGAQYRVVIDSRDQYRPDEIVTVLKKIVAAETDWMQDRPFLQYTFFYHLPRGLGRGGMEHAYSAAIETSASRLAEDRIPFASVSAHEFFHLWNVKRIRPQSLEPVDYTKENYTRALWFSEGVDSAVSEYMLVRAGIIDQKTFLARLAAQIRELQVRPAHQTQSVEQSSLDAWLEKYPYYRSADRSVNYYNKGQILGDLLDLAMREESQGKVSLRDLFQWMNQHYAKAGKFFDDSAGVRAAAEALTGTSFEEFFRKYVSGTDEIPYNDFFQTVGLELDQTPIRTAYAGLKTSLNFGSTAIVTAVDSGSEGEKAGLRPGDIILSANGQQPGVDLDAQIADLDPGSTLKLKVSTRDRVHEVKIKLGERGDAQYQLVDLPGATPQQLARRDAWIHGDSQPGDSKPGASETSH